MVSAGKVDEAYQHYGEACVLRPNLRSGISGMANILFDRHQLQDALEQSQFLAERISATVRT